MNLDAGVGGLALEASAPAAYRHRHPSKKETSMRRLVIAALVLAGLAACASAPVAPPPATATAGNAPAALVRRGVVHLAGASGSLVSGTLQLAPSAHGVRISGVIGGLAAGSSHGFHVHETGDCSAADAASAGGHFNPTASAHGRAGSRHHHAGDIDNLVAGWDGIAHVDVQLAGVTLGDGGRDDIAGRAFVVHAAPDDYRTQPSGNSGTRIACGVIALQ
jgi:Cu-Zn family superoxide dismutase